MGYCFQVPSLLNLQSLFIVHGQLAHGLLTSTNNWNFSLNANCLLGNNFLCWRGTWYPVYIQLPLTAQEEARDRMRFVEMPQNYRSWWINQLNPTWRALRSSSRGKVPVRRMPCPRKISAMPGARLDIRSPRIKICRSFIKLCGPAI